MITATLPHRSSVVTLWPEWRTRPPVLINRRVTLREVCSADALPLLAMISTSEVSRFISQPPTTVEGYYRFAVWSQRQRAEGRNICFGVVPEGHDTAVGIFQLQVRSGAAPEWGFAIGAAFWGTGLFVDAAEAVIDFAFRGMGLTRLGARAAVDNGRGNAALRKMGAECEWTIPGGLLKNGRTLDEHYWTLSADGQPRRKVVWR